MVRRVRRARRVVDEPGPFRVGRGLRLDVLDRVVGHRRDEVPARLAVVGMDRRGVAVEVARLPLARIAADKAVEIVVALTDRPVGERPLRTRLPGRHIVVLAEPGGGVAVLLEGQRSMRGLGPCDGVVAGIAGRGFGHRAETDPMMVPAGEQRGPCRRAERRVVHLGVAQAGSCELVQGRRRHDAAERRVGAEARIVDQDQEHIRRAFGRHDRRRPARLTVDEVRFDEAFEGRCRRRQHLLVGEFDRRRPIAPEPSCGSRLRRAPPPARPWRMTGIVAVDSS